MSSTSNSEKKTSNATHMLTALRKLWHRFGGLGILSALISNHTRRSEKPKAFVTRSLSRVFLQCFMHLVPVSSIVYLLTINFHNLYWSDAGERHVTTKMQAFQFAAKFIEGMIAYSLASIVISVLRTDLLGKRGVALGSLVATYNFSNMLMLLGGPFWARLPGFKRPSRSSLLLVLCLVLAAFIVIAAGPCTAVHLIPRLGWWPQSDPVALNGNNRFYINAPPSSLWPMVVNSSHLPSSSCLLSCEMQSPLCPGSSFTSLLDWGSYYNPTINTRLWPLPNITRPLSTKKDTKSKRNTKRQSASYIGSEKSLFALLWLDISLATRQLGKS